MNTVSVGTAGAGGQSASKRGIAKFAGGGAILAALVGSYVLGTHRAANREPRTPAVRESASQAFVPRAVETAPAIREHAEPQSAPVAAVEPALLEPDAPEPAPPPAGSPVQERDQALARLRASGRDFRLTAPATTVVKAWTNRLREFGVEGKLDPLECYAGGCALTILHPSLSAAQRGTDVVTRTAEFLGWQSSKMRSGFIYKDNERVEITWILDSPPQGGPVLSEPLPQDNLEELKGLAARGAN